MTSREELQWVLRAQCDDREALEALLRTAHPRLRRYLCGLVGAEEAEDILQEVLILICRNVGSLRVPELFWAWSFRIAHRLACRHLRQKRRRPEEALDGMAIDELQAIAPQDSSLMLDELLASGSLPPASKSVLLLHFREELSLAEVAAVLNIPAGTVKSRLAAGLTALRGLMQQERSS